MNALNQRFTLPRSLGEPRRFLVPNFPLIKGVEFVLEDLEEY